MKKKTREIMIGESTYAYLINEKYNQGMSEISLVISFKERKNITCSFQFCTWDDPIIGSPLLVGIPLKNLETETIEKFNLYYPKIVKQFILFGLKNGWNESTRLEFNDGLEILSQLGYEVDHLMCRD